MRQDAWLISQGGCHACCPSLVVRHVCSPASSVLLGGDNPGHLVLHCTLYPAQLPEGALTCCRYKIAYLAGPSSTSSAGLKLKPWNFN